MATTRFAHNAVPMERDFYADEDYAMGWNARQYVTAWTYFSYIELVVDYRLPFSDKVELFVHFLTGLQAAWNSQFPCPPLSGAMQVYAPELCPHKMTVLLRVLHVIRAAHEP